MKLIKTSNKYEVFDKDELIAASDNKSVPSINFENLSDEDSKKIGWVDIRKLGKENNWNTGNWEIRAFVDGFKTAQSLNEKKYSKREITEAVSQVLKAWGPSCINVKGEANIEFLAEIEMVLSQPKVFQVEVEMEEIEYGHVDDYSQPHGFKYQPKITSNSIKIIKIL